MSARIRYAYLKERTWLYRRNYPVDVALALGQKALKQSLKTGDPSIARVRAAEVNSRFETLVEEVRTQARETLGAPLADAPATDWGTSGEALLGRLRSALQHSDTVTVRSSFPRPVQRQVPKVREVSRTYLGLRSNELRPGGFKSVRYSVGLFVSKYGNLPLDQLSRDHGREFLSLVARLSPVLGRSLETQGLSLDQSVVVSDRSGRRITVRTQKRIWSQVRHFLAWTVYEGHLDQHPFDSVRFEGRVKGAPYAVPTDEEVIALLAARDKQIHEVLMFCLLSGMRAGEAAGLLREDLIDKGNLGLFVHVRPNAVRLLKTDAAERLVPLHPVLQDRLGDMPATERLFPGLSVNLVTKAFAQLRHRLKLERPGLVFHSTRKWFITQCERTGVPEHFTASLVGHKSARSENGITYGIYSAGISDQQKRGIVDQIRLPAGYSP